ncbi:MAG: 16S rRNA (uracil(1498)-N(3))-methyltransferase [Gammaproteobacteria bacterium]|nr:MAG: 16S rRNA (uracil(1498)-N(3))-methyltransferase [Gammaproteobacteria bacterium]
MRIPRIYQQQALNCDTAIELDASASHHLTRVLRLKTSDPIILFNGEGGEYNAELRIEHKKTFAIIKTFRDINNESPLEITLLQGISKGERMDIAIQKAVELGVKTIVPIFCQRSVVNLKHDRAEKKQHHWQGIIINACEQSGRTTVPTLATTVKLTDYLSKPIDGYKLTLDPTARQYLNTITPDSQRIILLIGPEGGLTDEEITLACQNGFNGINLGPRILRTETAALACIAALQSLWGDFRS